MSLQRKGCTIGNVKSGRGGGGESKKEKKSCTLAAFEKNIIPFQNVLSPSPPHISNGESISEISAGTSFLSRLRAPTLVQTFFKTFARWRTIYRRYEHQPNVHSVAVLPVCVNFPHTQSFADFSSFSFISFINTRKEQTIIVNIYLFSVVLNISNVCD